MQIKWLLSWGTQENKLKNLQTWKNPLWYNNNNIEKSVVFIYTNNIRRYNRRNHSNKNIHTHTQKKNSQDKLKVIFLKTEKNGKAYHVFGLKDSSS